MNDKPWGVLQVVANHEKRVVRHLEVRSLEHYLPLYTERSRWTDRTVTLERPLFPGYIFIRFTPDERIRVLSTPGVYKVLGDHKTGIVDHEEISRIQKALDSGCVLRPHPGVSVGMRVRVCRGIFQDVEGIVTELRGNCNVVLSLSSVEKYFSLQVEQDDVEILRESGSVQSPPTVTRHQERNPVNMRMRMT